MTSPTPPPQESPQEPVEKHSPNPSSETTPLDHPEETTTTPLLDEKPSLGKGRSLGRWLRARPWKTWAVEALVLGLLWFGITHYQTRNLIEEGAEAPAFTLQNLKGDELKLSDLKGKPTLLYFWAPWCSVCKMTSGHVGGILKSEGDTTNVISIVLSYKNREEVEQYLSENDIQHPVWFGDTALQKAYKIDSFPTFYILTPEGKVSSKVLGYTPEIALRMRLGLD